MYLSVLQQDLEKVSYSSHHSTHAQKYMYMHTNVHVHVVHQHQVFAFFSVSSVIPASPDLCSCEEEQALREVQPPDTPPGSNQRTGHAD